jgi:hypothetical protein
MNEILDLESGFGFSRGLRNLVGYSLLSPNVADFGKEPTGFLEIMTC